MSILYPNPCYNEACYNPIAFGQSIKCCSCVLIKTSKDKSMFKSKSIYNIYIGFITDIHKTRPSFSTHITDKYPGMIRPLV